MFIVKWLANSTLLSCFAIHGRRFDWALLNRLSSLGQPRLIGASRLFQFRMTTLLSDALQIHHSPQLTHAIYPQTAPPAAIPQATAEFRIARTKRLFMIFSILRWNSCATLPDGKGSSGIGLSKKAQSGSQPWCGSYSRNRSFAAAPLTRAACSSYTCLPLRLRSHRK